MKKITMFCAIAVVLSAFSIGCTSSGSGSSSSNWCRLGSPWSSSRTHKDTQTVYTTSAVGACNEVSACNPCEPVCNPCEPICDPCAMTCTGGVVSTGTVYPGPVSN